MASTSSSVAAISSSSSHGNNNKQGGVIDAYTHFAPPSLTAYLEEKAGGPLVFAKVG